MKHSLTKKVSLLLLFLLATGGGIFWFVQTAQGVNRTWDCGGGDSSWNNDLNWSGDTEPGASDVAIFDTTCTNNVTIDKNVSVAGISINAGYTGIITQSGSFTVTVGSSHYSQADGTFTGGSGTIDINGTFTLSGGTFTSTSGTLEIGIAGTAMCTSQTVFSITSGTFNHNNGTVKFVPGCSLTDDPTHTVDVQSSLTLYNIIVDSDSRNCGSTSTLSTGAGDTIIAANDFTFGQSNDPELGGTWEVQGDVTVGGSACGGYGTLTYTTSGAHTYTHSGSAIGPHLRVNHASATVSAADGTTSLITQGFFMPAGTFVAPTGTFRIGNQDKHICDDYTIFSVSSGATFTHNNGTVKFSPNCGNTGEPFITIDVPTTLTFYNLTIDSNSRSTSSEATIIPGSGDTIITANNFVFGETYDPSLGGSWQIQGNVTIGAAANDGSGSLIFTGGNNQTYTDQGGDEPNGDVTVNKTPGSSVRLASNADWNSTNQDVIVTSGELNMGASYNLSTTALTVSTDGHLSNYGTGDLTLAGNVSNSGNIRFMSNGTCGGSDSISIASSSAGVQRSWSGSGTYLFHDVTVQDQGGSAAITAYSSTSVSGNGVNWTFSGAACPATEPAANIQSGVINIQSGSWNVP